MRTMMFYYRRRTSLTQKALGDKCGISRQTINMLENRRIRKPKPETIAAVARALGVKPESIYLHGEYRVGF